MATPVTTVTTVRLPTDEGRPPLEGATSRPATPPPIPQTTIQDVLDGGGIGTPPVSPRVNGEGAPASTRGTPPPVRLTPEQQAKAELLKTAVERVLDQHRDRAGCLKRLFIYLFGRIAYKGEIKRQQDIEGKSLETLQAAAKNLAKQEASRRFLSKEEESIVQVAYKSPRDREIHAEHLRIEEATRLFREAFEQRVEVLQLEVNQHHCKVAFALVETAFKAQRTFVANGRMNSTHKPVFIDKVLQERINTFAKQPLIQITEDYFDFTQRLTTRFPDSFSPENTAEHQVKDAILKAHPNVAELNEAIATLREAQQNPSYLPRRVNENMTLRSEELRARNDTIQTELNAARAAGPSTEDPRARETIERLEQELASSFQDIRDFQDELRREEEKAQQSLIRQIKLLEELIGEPSPTPTGGPNRRRGFSDSDSRRMDPPQSPRSPRSEQPFRGSSPVPPFPPLPGPGGEQPIAVTPFLPQGLGDPLQEPVPQVVPQVVDRGASAPPVEQPVPPPPAVPQVVPQVVDERTAPLNRAGFLEHGTPIVFRDDKRGSNYEGFADGRGGCFWRDPSTKQWFHNHPTITGGDWKGTGQDGDIIPVLVEELNPAVAPPLVDRRPAAPAETSPLVDGRRAAPPVRPVITDDPSMFHEPQPTKDGMFVRQDRTTREWQIRAKGTNDWVPAEYDEQEKVGRAKQLEPVMPSRDPSSTRPLPEPVPAAPQPVPAAPQPEDPPMGAQWVSIPGSNTPILIVNHTDGHCYYRSNGGILFKAKWGETGKLLPLEIPTNIDFEVPPQPQHIPREIWDRFNQGRKAAPQPASAPVAAALRPASAPVPAAPRPASPPVVGQGGDSKGLHLHFTPVTGAQPVTTGRPSGTSVSFALTAVNSIPPGASFVTT